MKANKLITTVMTGALCHVMLVAARAQSTGPTAPVSAGENQPAAREAKQGPIETITEALRSEVGRKLKEAGASYEDLRVTVAMKRDSATPFKVTYRGLRNFKGSDGTTPDADGAFIMEYIGSGTWQGKLAGTQFTVPVGHTDNIDLPFVNDSAVLGEWESVDFVADLGDFNPAQRSWSGELYLKGLTFLENGRTGKPWWTWTRGVVIHRGDKTASRYEIREIGGQSYLFFEWKSGDVTISGMKPHYYVLKKKATNDNQ